MLLHDLLLCTAARQPAAPALVHGAGAFTYGQLAAQVQHLATALRASAGLAPGARVALWAEQRAEMVLGAWAAAAAGCVFVPLNPQLKPAQVAHVLADAGVSLVLTTQQRAALLAGHLPNPAPALVTVDEPDGPWQRWLAAEPAALPWAARRDDEIAAIFYTSGSTGRPKGVVLSHRNLVAGAESVASYLGNGPQDTLLAALPLSFDAGFSQLTTAFASGARVVLHNYLLPGDLLRALDEHQVTGLTAVPPLYMQLLQARPHEAGRSLRYFATTGGRMPRATLQALRARWPQAQPFLMYGLTEAFRSTYLPPEEVDRRPDSIGRAIPNAEILVLREDGTACDVGEPGELVHCGPLVAQGYWGDAQKTAERFRPLPPGLRLPGLVLPELAVFSGDTVRRDADGYLYFVGRRDEMIKTSGYRVSPTEVEEVLHGSGLVAECAVFGVEHATLGQAVHAVVTAPDIAAGVDVAALLAICRQQVPAYMVPVRIDVRPGPLPRNPNGKIDRRSLAAAMQAPGGSNT